MDRVQTPTYERPRRRGGSIVGPLVLIILGLVILGQNLGVLPSTIWTTILNYWPVLLILVGLELILGRGSWAGALVISIVILTIVGAGAFLSVFPWNDGGIRTGAFVPVETLDVVEEMGQVKQATYSLEFGAGSLTLGSLPQGSGSLVEGKLERDNRATLEKRVDRVGDQATVTMKGKPATATNTTNVGTTRMSLRLSPQTPTRLSINGGVGEMTLDLRDLNVTNLDLNSGVGGTKVELPRTGRSTVSVNAGVGGVEITVPPGVAAQISVDSGIGGADVDESRFVKTGRNTYRSSDYDTAANRVELNLSAGIGGVKVR